MSENKVYVVGFSVRLDSISYKTEKRDATKDNQVKIAEEYEIENINFNQFEIKVTRKFCVFPEKMFDGKIVVEILFDLDEEKTKENFETVGELKKYIESKPYLFVNKTPVGASIALLAGQITSTFSGVPLWMNPVVNDEKND